MSKKNTIQQNDVPQSSESPSTRREVLKLTAAAGIGACAVGAPFCAGTRSLLAPLFAESTGGKFYPVAQLNLISDKPSKFSIIDEKRDAWTTFSQQKIGSVYVVRDGDEILAFQALCPHAGCAIQFGRKKNPQTGAEEEMFFCPCHSAHFSQAGKRLDTVSPRDMDILDVKVEDGQVLVKFQNFTFGIADKR